MWIIRRLKSLGASDEELIEILKQQIVSICEVGVPFWGPMITVAESNMLEVQSMFIAAGAHINQIATNGLEKRVALRLILQQAAQKTKTKKNQI